MNKLREHTIHIVEKDPREPEHTQVHIERVHCHDGTVASIKALYSLTAFEQHCSIPQRLGCELTQEGYIKVDPQQRTSMHGVYACGDNITRLRTVANAVAMGTTAGVMVNKELVAEEI